MASSEASQQSEATVSVASNLDDVRRNIQEASAKRNGSSNSNSSVRLVAVSKTKPIPLLMEAYQHGQRVFGENYVQELVEKAAELPKDIEWHFIGPLQSNKANLLVQSVVPQCRQLTVETVATLKLANKLNKAMNDVITKSSNEDNDDEKKNNTEKRLNVFVQVNTSGEESKSGVEPSEVVGLIRDIQANCPHLSVRGLMTIGAPGDLGCFDMLVQCRDQVQAELHMLGEESLELSMGMSGDYVEAIARGATNVRVGSTIFGARDYSQKK